MFPYLAFLQANSGWSSSQGTLGQLFVIVASFVFILVLAAYTTKWVASARNFTQRKSYLKVVEGVSLGLQAGLQLVKVGERYFLLGVTKEQITFIAEIPKDEIPLQPEAVKIPFEKYLNQYRHKDKS